MFAFLLACVRALPLGTSSDADFEWDLIVVGAGTSGIIAATIAAERGKTTLLLEAGGPSLYRDGARIQSPAWQGTEFGLHDLAGFTHASFDEASAQLDEFCKDGPFTGVDALPCLLGGGTAIHAQQHIKPPAKYFDENYPDGYKAKDILDAARRVEARMPSMQTTSADGRLYRQETYAVISDIAKRLGGIEVDHNSESAFYENGNLTFGHQHFTSVDGQRGGPMRGYLDDARKLDNFELLLHAQVESIIRTGAAITGVKAVVNGEKQEFKAKNVVLSAGTFGNPRILWRSGIGPEDVLNDAKTAGIIETTEAWILNDAVGRNIFDTPSFSINLAHPNIIPYDINAAWLTPIEGDKQQAISSHSGQITVYGRTILWLWQEPRSDGKGEMQVEILCSPGAKDHDITCQFNLNGGPTSRARAGIDPATGKTKLLTPGPWYTEDVDLETYAAALTNVRAIFANSPDITVQSPTCNDFDTCKQKLVDRSTKGLQQGNKHWGGSTKLGADDGTKAGGTSAVDLKMKVYGTDNLFIVDGSVATAPSTSNPAYLYFILAERGISLVLSDIKQ